MMPRVSDWFADDEPLDARRKLFLDRLRERATRWHWCDAARTYAFPRPATGALDLAVDVPGRDGRPVAMTLAVHYESDSIRCSAVRRAAKAAEGPVAESLPGGGLPAEGSPVGGARAAVKGPARVPELQSSGDPATLAMIAATWVEAAARVISSNGVLATD
jgi:hypothetical protein